MKHQKTYKKQQLISQIITYGGNPESFSQNNKKVRKILNQLERRKKTVHMPEIRKQNQMMMKINERAANQNYNYTENLMSQSIQEYFEAKKPSLKKHGSIK